ncbi:potassium transporter TrkG [Iamia majanohamensis]|uniref:Potassium transporter TrkG n=1 Tax=Iamia majanohamensis TaxID=467976 RepID=A0AAE9Y970_9ACTN|nr:potassium transporter TrkG [Iamia majanohamensis]WCO66644.1 potassium transporter TrkG [Iamia majanohamensis]
MRGGRQTILGRRHPTQVVVLGFLAVIGVGTVLLRLPIASEPSADIGLREALFTSTSAATVTGLIVVDTSTAWTTFGQVVILALIQVGGFGLMAVSSVVAVVLARRIGLRHRMAAQAETGALRLGDLRSVVLGVVGWSLVVEGAAAVLLSGGFVVIHGEGLARGTWMGLFHSVSAFNNAGFALQSDSLERYVDDPWTTGIISVAIILGGLGFPVLMELRRQLGSPRWWSVHTKMTLTTTLSLFALGALAVLALEWTNPDTLGALGVGDKLTASWFQGVTPRTAGFNSLDYGALREGTLLVTVVLMFIGAASGSTGGGIKVTTFALLGFAIWAEVRGQREVEAFRRRLPGTAQRQALAVALIGVAAVVAGTLALVTLSGIDLTSGLFETTSAFSTVGLSTGVTDTLGGPSEVVLGVLMFAGRAGPVTLAAALVLRERDSRYRYPEERPLVG